ncbi:MAG: RHS repeat-associated core domain-containing protein [Pirellulales bacterium]|nr:RHS repeat-associated core domain-containing protein [Pirellulales bacterium]
MLATSLAATDSRHSFRFIDDDRGNDGLGNDRLENWDDPTGPQLAALPSGNADADAPGALYYNYPRWYDPTVGRFISEDPIQDGTNWYEYAGNNPVLYVDPSGLSFVHPLETFGRGIDQASHAIASGLSSAVSSTVSTLSRFGGSDGTTTNSSTANSSGNQIQTLGPFRIERGARQQAETALALGQQLNAVRREQGALLNFPPGGGLAGASLPGFGARSAPASFETVLLQHNLAVEEQSIRQRFQQAGLNEVVLATPIYSDEGHVLVHDALSPGIDSVAFAAANADRYEPPGFRGSVQSVAGPEVALGFGASSFLQRGVTAGVVALAEESTGVPVFNPRVGTRSSAGEVAESGTRTSGSYPSTYLSGRYANAASDPGAYQASGGRVFPTLRNSGFRGATLRAEQQAFTERRLREGHPVRTIRGQAREAGLRVDGRNEVLADIGAENAVLRAIQAVESRTP